ncbi:ferrochelatase [Pantoea sp. Mb-10]|uniref:ferrochelatase n=1 Tax=unclassified Pantoea TaxID=2630326 RepID=UPI001E372B96|nr:MULTISPECIES: ferrochelatase [unclassified Pantoea]MCE0489120.1 ferrochelatase [Pantoea sp. Mb-10]MCE0503130.1 ferrochelatase [Pantoea sp. Pb-8]
MTTKPGVLLVNLGTPTEPTPQAVKKFLSKFLHDYRVVDLPRIIWCPILHGAIIPLRAKRVAKAYASIWMDEGSPLMVYSVRQARMLAQETGLPVALGMSYGEPSIGGAIDELLAKGVDRIIVIPLYPQFSSSTVSSVWDSVSRHLQTMKNRYTPAISFINDYADHPAYIEGLRASVEASFAANGVPDALLVSYHGIPVRFEKEGDNYRERCELTTKLLIEALNMPSVKIMMTFQSRFGREPWLTPFTDETIQGLPAQGIKRLQVISPGFAADCLETLEELDEQNREFFMHAGGTSFHYIPALNDTPAHIELLRQLAEGVR